MPLAWRAGCSPPIQVRSDCIRHVTRGASSRQTTHATGLRGTVSAIDSVCDLSEGGAGVRGEFLAHMGRLGSLTGRQATKTCAARRLPAAPPARIPERTGHRSARRRKAGAANTEHRRVRLGRRSHRCLAPPTAAPSARGERVGRGRAWGTLAGEPGGVSAGGPTLRSRRSPQRGLPTVTRLFGSGPASNVYPVGSSPAGMLQGKTPGSSSAPSENAVPVVRKRKTKLQACQKQARCASKENRGRERVGRRGTRRSRHVGCESPQITEQRRELREATSTRGTNLKTGVSPIPPEPPRTSATRQAPKIITAQQP